MYNKYLFFNYVWSFRKLNFIKFFDLDNGLKLKLGKNGILLVRDMIVSATASSNIY